MAGDLIVFTNNNATGGGTVFVGTWSSGSGIFNSIAGQTTFADTSTAANATLIANGLDFGSAIFFEGDSTGGTARVEVFAGNSTMATWTPATLLRSMLAVEPGGRPTSARELLTVQRCRQVIANPSLSFT